MLNRLFLLAGAAAAVALVAQPRFGESHIVRRALAASVWDSVYTVEQAARGDSLYNASGCVKCHGATLAGGDDGSPLVGDEFMGNWQGLGLDELYSTIRKSMPPDNPNSIPREQIPDFIGFILSKNGFPAGANPLPDDLDKLKEIKIEKTKP